MTSYVVPQAGLPSARRAFPLVVLSGIVIWLMIIPLFFLDICTAVYHAVYFTINSMPKVPRADHIVIDRQRLTKLNWGQKLNCMYCDYANGVLSWVKAIANTTEAYSCAIKHARTAKGQEHQSGYYPYEKFL